MNFGSESGPKSVTHGAPADPNDWAHRLLDLDDAFLQARTSAPMSTALIPMALIALALAPTALLAQQAAGATQTSQPHAQQSSPSAARTDGQSPQGLAPGSALVGRNVFDSSGAPVAEVKDLVIDSSGQVMAVVQRQSGGLAGIPFSCLTPQLAMPKNVEERNTRAPPIVPLDTTPMIDRFVFPGDTDQLRTAPVILDISKVDDNWVTQTRQHFGIAPATTLVQAAATPKGSRQSMSRRAVGLHELTRHGLSTVSGDRLGDIRDIAIDLADGRVNYLLFSRQRAGQSGETIHGVALDSLLFDDSMNGTLDIDPRALDQSPGLDLGRLPHDPSVRLP
jgi:sporulation protein YlmC with PRC-barrel domain